MIRQRGVILLSALIMVALATIIAASLFFKTVMTARRAAANFSMEQALLLAEGSEALAAYGLSQDTNQTDTPLEDWAAPYGPVEVEKGITLEAQLSDEQAKFNINTLVNADGTPNANAVKVFRRLLELCGLETKWADMVVDLTDTDNVPVPGGAEDNIYITLMPPHLAGNIKMTSISELMQLPGFTKEMYDKLVDHVTALPPSVTQINVCTADGFVLDALYALSTKHTGYVEHSARSPEDMTQLRANECFPRKADLVAEEPSINPMTVERTSYLRLKTWITIGSAEYTLYSLLFRSGNQARAVVRNFGTD